MSADPGNERAETVNGVKVGHRPVCTDGQHLFAAHHGYCVRCGTDGWDAATRKATLSAQAQVPRG